MNAATERNKARSVLDQARDALAGAPSGPEYERTAAAYDEAFRHAYEIGVCTPSGELLLFSSEEMRIQLVRGTGQ